MKKTLLFAFSLLISLVHLSGQCGNLYIGGVIDGPLTSGTPKGIQICASGDIADLSIYGIGVANNGGGSDGQEYTFPAGMVSSGDCFWVAYEGTNPGSFNAFFGFTPCYINSITNINGDDPVELFCSGSLEDEFGDVALDGTGECWEYLDGWAVNNIGSPNYGAFDCGDWTFSGTNALDGESSNATASTPYPSPVQICPAALPVKLISFLAKSRNSSIELSWTTASELNNDFFSIQHSADGRTFEEIHRISGAGTSNVEQNYSFIHRSPKDGSNYYRLQQNDLDGGFEYSFVRVVDVKLQSEIRAFPNQASESITIDFRKPLEEATIIDVYDIMGRRVLSSVIEAETTQSEVNIVSLSKGNYFIRVQSGEETYKGRFIKIN